MPVPKPVLKLPSLNPLRTACLAVVLAGVASPALALLPPIYYEQARNTAANVVVLKVTSVREPDAAYGTCTVRGTVRQAERGTLYGVGARIKVEVPCAKAGSRPPIGGTIYAAPAALRKAPFGRAYLDAAGGLVQSQYQMLERPR